jgi:anti-anti-sigma factor
MITSERIDGVEVIGFSTDRLNALNVDTVRPSIEKLFETPYTRVMIDLTGVEYLDSTAFAMFLYLLRAATSNYCTIKLCGLAPHPMELFELLQLHKSFDIYPDRASCLSSYSRTSPTG